jgi:uncharacterized FlgJ-related protein
MKQNINKILKIMKDVFRLDQDSMIYKKVRAISLKTFVITLMSIMILSIVILAFVYDNQAKKSENLSKDINYLTEFIETSNEVECTPDNIRNYIATHYKNIPPNVIDVIVAQSILESGHFMSPLFCICSNLFGMKVAHHRPQKRVGEYDGYATYLRWRESIDDYILLYMPIIYNCDHNTTHSQYLDAIHTHAEDSAYNKKILDIIFSAWD